MCSDRVWNLWCKNGHHCNYFIHEDEIRSSYNPAPPPSLLEDNSDLKLGYLIYLNRPSTLLCKALNFAEAKCNDVPSARCTARNSTFRLANRMLLWTSGGSTIRFPWNSSSCSLKQLYWQPGVFAMPPQWKWIESSPFHWASTIFSKQGDLISSLGFRRESGPSSFLRFGWATTQAGTRCN